VPAEEHTGAGSPRAGRNLAGRLIALLFALSAASDLAQVVEFFRGGTTQPATLAVEHAVTCVTALATAVGLWRGARWTAAAAIVWGLATTLLLATLPRVLGLPREARAGVWAGAAISLVLALLVAIFARRRYGGAGGGA
jgi:amino acid permease